MFAVLVQHNTGHGEVGSLLLVTTDAYEAVEAAKNAESTGYEFHSSEVGTWIVAFKMHKPIGKHEQDVMYSRIKLGDSWREEWPSESFKAMYQLQNPFKEDEIGRQYMNVPLDRVPQEHRSAVMRYRY